MEEQSWQRLEPIGAHNNKGILLEQAVEYPEQSNKTTVLTRESVHGKVGQGVEQWAWEQQLITKQRLRALKTAMVA